MKIEELRKKMVAEKDMPYICDICGMECSVLYEHGKLRICVNCKMDLNYYKTRP